MYYKALRIGNIYFENMGTGIEITIMQDEGAFRARIPDYHYDDLLLVLKEMGIGRKFKQLADYYSNQVAQYHKLINEEKEYLNTGNPTPEYAQSIREKIQKYEDKLQQYYAYLTVYSKLHELWEELCGELRKLEQPKREGQ